MIDETRRERLRQLPAVHRILSHPVCADLQRRAPRELVAEGASRAVARHRERILAGVASVPELEELARETAEWVESKLRPHLRPVINATGVVLHTNLGRAPLAESAVEQVVRVARGYSNLELRLETGKRGSRHEHVEDLLCRLTGAEAAMVVNNNAAAVLLVLRTLASGRNVIVSRGELVEIGGSFRVSEVMAESGARLVEVGTTNKTHDYDYERAIDGETAMIMRTHTSNFRIVGFTSRPSREELAALCRKHSLLLYEDLGSGVLFDIRKWGIGDEPTVRECVAAGVDVVSFSGDKLLGGAQAGIVVGKKNVVEKLKKHQLARALRVDKLTLAALEATLRLYLDEERAAREIPVLWMLRRRPEELKTAAERLAAAIRPASGGEVAVRVTPDVSQVGGGSLPAVELPTYTVVLEGRRWGAAALETALRTGEPPIMGRIHREEVRLDVRTIFPHELELCAEGIRRAFEQLRSRSRQPGEADGPVQQGRVRV
ncbi:MAG: L-seryl-tRNA(Sec) selenium transferase [Alicyclobacillaceae bacterium]|nr:L-seryl-tRNA(Sec) selenium transferase [Alicyclobacillaceae bacterium]